MIELSDMMEACSAARKKELENLKSVADTGNHVRLHGDTCWYRIAHILQTGTCSTKDLLEGNIHTYNKIIFLEQTNSPFLTKDIKLTMQCLDERSSNCIDEVREPSSLIAAWRRL